MGKLTSLPFFFESHHVWTRARKVIITVTTARTIPAISPPLEPWGVGGAKSRGVRISVAGMIIGVYKV